MLRELVPVSRHSVANRNRSRPSAASRCEILIKLAPNSIVELKKPAGEPFDICINGLPVARGEVIVVEQSSGVRIVEVQKSGSLG